jgi:hypothetical protein
MASARVWGQVLAFQLAEATALEQAQPRAKEWANLTALVWALTLVEEEVHS